MGYDLPNEQREIKVTEIQFQLETSLSGLCGMCVCVFVCVSVCLKIS